ncbi:MAG: HEAT repeat domain-containing protein [Desulfomonilia bacterium]
MINFDDTYSKTISPGPINEELEAAKKVIVTLLLARKNHSLYPENHTICMNVIAQLHTQLDTYLRKYGFLRLNIESDQLVSDGEIIHSESPEEGALPFTLFRDGIRWLEFTKGIDPEELKEFIKIINKYSILSDEPEGDIVTAFWETQFLHIKYEVADFSWGSEQDSDFPPPFDTWDNGSKLFGGDKSAQREVDFTILSKKGDNVSVSLRENKLVDWETLTDPAIDQDSLLLTPEEKEIVKEMRCREEEANPTEYLDALFDSLLEHREQENFEIILEILEEEFKNALTRKDFDIMLKILQSLQYVLNTCTVEIPWASPLIEDFFLTVSSSQSLSPLLAIWPDIDSGQVAKIEQILKLLQPDAIHTLGIILLQNHSLQLRQMLVDVMISLASRDLRPLESLLKSQDEKLVEMLVNVCVKLKGDRPSKILMKLVRHTSTNVRQEAIKGLLQRGHTRIHDIFKLIDDKDETIRRLILRQMGKSRDHITEGLLLDYLEHRKFKSADGEHVIACFITLGQCGSSRSIPFLRRTLLGWGWMPTFWRAAHRNGAAIALSMLGMEEARQVLEGAGRCLYPSVRRIVRKVKKDLTKLKAA